MTIHPIFPIGTQRHDGKIKRSSLLYGAPGIPKLKDNFIMSDPLSEVLRSVRLTGGVFLDAKLTAPWCIASQVSPEHCKPFLAKPEQMIAYHVVLEGRMLVAVDGEPPIELRAGEIILLPRNDVHVMSSEIGLRPVGAAELIQQSADGALLEVQYGGGRELTSIVCGYLGAEDVFNPVLSALPRILRLDVKMAASRTWIETSVRYAAAELMRGGWRRRT